MNTRSAENQTPSLRKGSEGWLNIIHQTSIVFVDFKTQFYRNPRLVQDNALKILFWYSLCNYFLMAWLINLYKKSFLVYSFSISMFWNAFRRAQEKNMVNGWTF